MELVSIMWFLTAVVAYFALIGFVAKFKGYRKRYRLLLAVLFPGLALFVLLFAHHKNGNPIS